MKKKNGVMKEKDGIFVLDEHSPEDVARAMVEGGKQQEAFYLLDLDEVFRRIQHFKTLMPRVKIFYGGRSSFPCRQRVLFKGSYITGLQYARALFDYEEKAGRSMRVVDIGGGFLSDRMDRIDQVAELVNSSLSRLFPNPAVQVIAEPGRYLCDSAATFYTNIINIRQVIRNERPTNLIYINDGIYGTLRFPEPWHTVEMFLWSGEEESQVKEETILFGPSCDSEDQVMKDHQVMLPKCTPSDWLVFKSQGAYTLTFASRFSRLQLPLVRSVISSELWKHIKNLPVFDPSQFVVNPDLSAALPSTLPPMEKRHGEYIYSPILNV